MTILSAIGIRNGQDVGESLEEVGKRFQWLLHKIEIALLAVAALSVVLMAILINGTVIGRLGFNQPVPLTLEIVSFYMMVIAGFLPLAIAQFHKEHLRVLFFSEWMPPKWKTAVDMVVYFVLAFLVMLLLFYGYEVAWESTLDREYETGVPPLEIWPARWAVPIGWGVLILQLFADGVREAWNLSHGRVSGQEGEAETIEAEAGFE